MPKRPTLARLGEFGWLKRLLPKLYWPNSRASNLWIGPGDDAGAVGVTPGYGLVVTTDALVEGVHFDPAWGRWDWLGEKILAVNLSDLAAMGAVQPIGVVISAGFPGDTPVDTVDKLYMGMKQCARRWGVGFLGGDTVGSRKGLFFSVAAFGQARRQDLVKRSGARVGDWVVATGPCGLAGAGLDVLKTRQNRLTWTRPLVRALCRPEPRFKAGAWLGRRQIATSMMDISDGLGASARLLAEASNLGVELKLSEVLPHPALQRWSIHHRQDPFGYMLFGGEDYELLFTIRPEQWNVVRRTLRNSRVVGVMRPKRFGCTVTLKEKKIPLTSYGFAHFKEK